MTKWIRKSLAGALPVIAVLAASAGGAMTLNHNVTIIRGDSR
jgi:hypothetical protein